jgi:hypothetical protein
MLFLFACLLYVGGWWIDICVYVIVLSMSSVVVLLLFPIIQHTCCFPYLSRSPFEWVGYKDRIGMWMCRMWMYKT